MNYARADRYAEHPYEYGGETPAASVERKYREEILPHFYAPSTRQRSLESLAPPSLSIESEMELDSPRFTPPALEEFEARAFVRRNRWSQ